MYVLYTVCDKNNKRVKVREESKTGIKEIDLYKQKTGSLWVVILENISISSGVKGRVWPKLQKGGQK